MTILKPQKLERAAFAPFGEVLEYTPGDPLRHDFAAKLFNDRPAAKPNLRVQYTQPTPLPLTITMIERHRHSSQMFAPLSGGSYLVIVFPSGSNGDPVLEAGSAFIGQGNQAINYNVDTWHHGFLALDGPGTFLMLRWENGTGGDEEFLQLSTSLRVEA
jgi:ureidoglycolate lyase